jgi:hypothetical protein
VRVSAARRSPRARGSRRRAPARQRHGAATWMFGLHEWLIQRELLPLLRASMIKLLERCIE